MVSLCHGLIHMSEPKCDIMDESNDSYRDLQPYDCESLNEDTFVQRCCNET